MERIIDKTKKWIEDFIIGEDICPFAKEPFYSNVINFVVSDQEHIEEVIKSEILNLDNKLYQTSFLILNYKIDYYGLVDLIDYLNTCYNTTDKYQLIAFHPNFHFNDIAETEIANYVNKSPYPMIHLLKNSELDQLLNTEQAKNLSLKNEKKLIKMSQKRLMSYFSHLKDSNS
jgi:hypothetical protein